MKDIYGFGKFLFLSCVLLLAGCVSLTYKDVSGRQVNYTRLGSQAIKGLAVNQTGNSVYLTIESAQSDTQALTSAVSTLATVAAEGVK